MLRQLQHQHQQHQQPPLQPQHVRQMVAHAHPMEHAAAVFAEQMRMEITISVWLQATPVPAKPHQKHIQIVVIAIIVHIRGRQVAMVELAQPVVGMTTIAAEVMNYAVIHPPVIQRNMAKRTDSVWAACVGQTQKTPISLPIAAPERPAAGRPGIPVVVANQHHVQEHVHLADIKMTPYQVEQQPVGKYNQ